MLLAKDFVLRQQANCTALDILADAHFGPCLRASTVLASGLRDSGVSPKSLNP